MFKNHGRTIMSHKTKLCLFLLLFLLSGYVCAKKKSEESVKNSNNLVDHTKVEKDYQQDITAKDENTPGDCISVGDGLCLPPSRVLSFKAIEELHAHLDDDHSGDIDFSESVGFLREELNYTKGLENRQSALHYNNDQQVSVNELWQVWQSNEVHNWTVEQTVAWLYMNVELGQYAEIFYEKDINGSHLPILATNTEQFLSRSLGIKNPNHRSKICIKAMDIVLFGPPKETGSLFKDIFIASLMTVILVMLYKFKRLSDYNNKITCKMDKEMEVLQQELLRVRHEKRLQEEAGGRLTPQRRRASEVETKEAQEKILKEKPTLPTVPADASEDAGEGISDDGVSRRWDNDDEYFERTDEDEEELAFADLDLPVRQELQKWLQLTYERERQALENKMRSIEMQLSEARDICEKLKPNKKNLFGALSFIHGKMESKGKPVIQVRAALEEYRMMAKEMEFRWSSVERLSGFEVTPNEGLDQLQMLLEPALHTPRMPPANSAVGKNTSTDSSSVPSRANSLLNLSISASEPSLSSNNRLGPLAYERTSLRSISSCKRRTQGAETTNARHTFPLIPVVQEEE